MSEAQCATLACDAVGLVITTLQLAQFLPQLYEMHRDKSSVGISPWLLFFSGLYTFLAAVDTVLLGAGDAFTCGEGAYRCFIESQPLFQMIGSAALSASMWYFYLRYSHDFDDSPTSNAESSLQHSLLYGRVDGRVFFRLFLALSTFSAAVALFLVLAFGQGSAAVESYAHFCGLAAAVLNAVMWMPQIVVTYTFRHKGALSIGWVVSSIVMDVAYSIYLAKMGLHFSVWINNVPDGLQTSVLLVMVLHYEYQDDQRGLDDYGHTIHSLSNHDEEAAHTVLLKPAAKSDSTTSLPLAPSKRDYTTFPRSQ